MSSSLQMMKGKLRNRLAPLRLCTSLLLLLLLSQVFAQRDARVPDPDPELERRSFQVAEGFEVNLFAADPLLAKPIQMNFDAAGRLWVACSEAYPQVKPGQKANDKVVVLEDANGDGKADRTTVFADSLLIPTGLEPGDGGVYVADSTDLVHLQDTDGDGKADRRRVLLSGFGTEDTHHLLHTLRWGPDGMLYMNQSIYIHSHIETPYGVRRLNGGGIWQYRPETHRLEVLARGFVNPWGHQFDRWGQQFVTDGAYGEGINYLMPGAWYVTAVGAARTLPGMNPGSPKHCGLEILSGRHLPEAWRGNLVTNDFRGHRVCRFVLSEDGSGFASREQPELIKTTHAGFRPIDVKMGPDGAIYLADWYNPIIQHGEVDFRDPRRDLTRGRIWRVTAKGRPLVPRPKLVGASTADLLAALTVPEDWTRHHAKRLLKERGVRVLPELTDWAAQRDTNIPEHEHHLLEALWTYQALDVVEPRLLAQLLAAREPRIRAAAARVLGTWHNRIPEALDWLAKRAVDDHPRVRLEAVRSLSRIPQARAAEVALRSLDRPVDRFLEYGLWLTLRELEPHWLPALRAGNWEAAERLPHLLFALQAVGSPAVVPPLVELLQRGKVPGEHEEGVLQLVASLGGPSELALLLEHALNEDKNDEQRAKLLLTLTQAARERQQRPSGDLTRVGPLLEAKDGRVQAAALRLAGAWRLESLRPRLFQSASQAYTPLAVRLAAIDGLAMLGGAASIRELEQLTAYPEILSVRSMAVVVFRPFAVRQAAVVALTSLDLAAAARLAAEVLTTPQQPDHDPTEMVAAFVQRKGGTAALAAALADKSLFPDVAKRALRAARSAGKPDPVLTAALTKAGGLAARPSAITPEQLKQLIADVPTHGDAARGEAIYHRKDQQCLKCHAIAGAGGRVGPDLVSIGASAQVDYLIESLLMPNKAIKEGYHSLVVATKDGRVHTGIPVRQSARELVLRDAEDREVTILTASIEEKANGPSLMPDGLADTLTRGELLDLVRFLSELGKVGSYAVGRAEVVRRWQVLEATPEARQVLQRTGFAAAAEPGSTLPWTPAYSWVNGSLTLDSVPKLALRKQLSVGTDHRGFVRCQLEVTAAGMVKLLLNDPKGLSLWIDGRPHEALAEILVELKPGIRTVTFALDLDRRNTGLRCELQEILGSTARVRVVGGK